jgi:phosphohistidine phosphatase SixA
MCTWCITATLSVQTSIRGGRCRTPDGWPWRRRQQLLRRAVRARLSATRDLQPDDPPQWIRDRLRAERRDVLIAGHFPHLPRLLSALLGEHGFGARSFPLHGAVALTTEDEGETWREVWRIGSEG